MREAERLVDLFWFQHGIRNGHTGHRTRTCETPDGVRVRGHHMNTAWGRERVRVYPARIVMIRDVIALCAKKKADLLPGQMSKNACGRGRI